MTEENKATDKKIDPKNRQLSIQEYKALQEKEAKKFKGFKLPLVVKIIFSLPLIAICLFGLFFIPFMAIRGCASSSTTTTK